MTASGDTTRARARQLSALIRTWLAAVFSSRWVLVRVPGIAMMSFREPNTQAARAGK
jgi:hypothetical protein